MLFNVVRHNFDRGLDFGSLFYCGKTEAASDRMLDLGEEGDWLLLEINLPNCSR